MLLVAIVQKRGLADRTFSESPDSIEREHGHRNALVKTPGGQTFHIHDRQFHSPYPRDLLPGLGRSSRGPRAYPPRGNGLVVIESFGAARRHGPNPEVRQWTLLPDYRRALQQTFAQGGQVTMRPQPSLTKLIINFMDDTWSPTTREAWVALEDLLHQLQSRHGINPCYLQYLKSYFLLGRKEEDAHQFLT